jgi:hypothetical protein
MTQVFGTPRKRRDAAMMSPLGIHFRSSCSLRVFLILGPIRHAPRPAILQSKIECRDRRKTAKALGLTVPPTLLARADEVIE